MYISEGLYGRKPFTDAKVLIALTIIISVSSQFLPSERLVSGSQKDNSESVYEENRIPYYNCEKDGPMRDPLLPSLFITSDTLAFASSREAKGFVYDENGIPYYYYARIGLERNPLFIANEVLYHSSYYEKTGNNLSKQVATNNANWLVCNAIPRGNYSILEYDFPFAQYKMEPPWRSATAQGRAIEALASAHELTNNQTYLDAAKSLLNSFFVEVKDGGVTYKTPNDGWWYEDFADVGTNATKALDGMISAILSLNRYYENANDSDAKFLFDQGVDGLRKNLALYDNNGYTYFDIHKRPSPPKYHDFQVGLLGRLLDIVGDDEVLRKYHDKWSKSTMR